MLSWTDLFQARVEIPGHIPKASSLSFGLPIGLNSIRGRDQAEPRFDLDGVAFRHDYSDQLHLVRTVCLQRFATPGVVSETNKSLLELVEQYGTITQCGNNLDKVFAFLAMQAEDTAIVPYYNASAVDLLLQLIVPDPFANILPYLNMLGFTYEGDCNLVDFLLDEFEPRLSSMLVDWSSEEPWKRYFTLFIDLVQAIWDSGRRSQSHRLGKAFSKQPQRYKFPLKEGLKADGRELTPSARDAERRRRYTWDKDGLWNIRAGLRGNGAWPPPRRTAWTISSQPSQSGHQQRAPFEWVGPIWLAGTQPISDEAWNHRQSHQGKWYESKRPGAWVRPSVINTRQTQQEFAVKSLHESWSFDFNQAEIDYGPGKWFS